MRIEKSIVAVLGLSMLVTGSLADSNIRNAFDGAKDNGMDKLGGAFGGKDAGDKSLGDGKNDYGFGGIGKNDNGFGDKGKNNNGNNGNGFGNNGKNDRNFGNKNYGKNHDKDYGSPIFSNNNNKDCDQYGRPLQGIGHNDCNLGKNDHDNDCDQYGKPSYRNNNCDQYSKPIACDLGNNYNNNQNCYQDVNPINCNVGSNYNNNQGCYQNAQPTIYCPDNTDCNLSNNNQNCATKSIKASLVGCASLNVGQGNNNCDTHNDCDDHQQNDCDNHDDCNDQHNDCNDNSGFKSVGTKIKAAASGVLNLAVKH